VRSSVAGRRTFRKRQNILNALVDQSLPFQLEHIGAHVGSALCSLKAKH